MEMAPDILLREAQKPSLSFHFEEIYLFIWLYYFMELENDWVSITCLPQLINFRKSEMQKYHIYKFYYQHIFMSEGLVKKFTYVN